MKTKIYLISLGGALVLLTACSSIEVLAQAVAQGPAGPSVNAGGSFGASTAVTPGSMTPGTSGGFGNTVPGSALSSNGAPSMPSPPPPTTMDGLSPNPGTLNMSAGTPALNSSQSYSTPFNSEYAYPNAMDAIDTPPGIMPRVDDMSRPNGNTSQNDINSRGSTGVGLSPF